MNKLAIGLALLLYTTILQAALFAHDLDGDPTNGHDLVYDDVLDITWMADANLISNFVWAPHILDSPEISSQWVQGLNSYDGGAGWLGVNTWRLPTMSPLNGSSFTGTVTYDGSSDAGFQLSAPIGINNPNGQSAGFIGSELAYHYYNNFGGTGYCSGTGNQCQTVAPSELWGLAGASDPNNYLTLFYNTDSARTYRSGTRIGRNVFVFNMSMGLQHSFPSHASGGGRAWVVADGDVTQYATAQGEYFLITPIPSSILLFCSGVLLLIRPQLI